MTLTLHRPVAAPPRRTVRAAPVAVMLALAALHALVLADAPAVLRTAIGLPLVMLLPGALLLRAIGVRRHGPELIFHAVVASLAVLLATATGLALAGRLSPRDCLIGLDLTLVVLAVAAAVRGRHHARAGEDGRVPVGRIPAPAVLVNTATVFAGAVAVPLAVLGAARLNAGGGPLLSLVALTAVLAAVAGAAYAAGRHRPGVAAGALYLAGLAVLLATSLRGTGVTGHDIKIEYHVLVDVLDAGRWRPGGVYPGYNSCLSLTTLPAFLARLLGLAPLDVYRVAYQVVFALAPVGAFLLARRLLPPVAAVLAAGLFIAFPTFVNDMPMLNRQELALLFFLVLLLGLVDVRGPRGPRIALVLIAAAGLTVSHYSSTAVAVALLAVAALLRLARRRVPSMVDGTRRPPALAWPAGLLAAMLVGWAVCTGSATAFATGLAETGRAIGARAAVLSDSTRYLRPGEDAPDDRAALTSYVDGLGAERSLSALPSCPPAVLPADELPPTALGDAIRAPGTANTLLRQAAMLLFLGGAVAGCAVLWWRSRRAGLTPGLAGRARSGSDHADGAGLGPGRVDRAGFAADGAGSGGLTASGAGARPVAARVEGAGSLAGRVEGAGSLAGGADPGGIPTHRAGRFAGRRRYARPLWSGARRSTRPAVRIFAELGTAALVLLGIAVIAPQITDSYGLLRLYQQMLPLLGPAVLLALWAWPRRATATPGLATTALVVVVLASTSGLVPRLTGGYPPQLNLADAGPYYHAWYATDAHARDAAAVERALPPGAPLLADSWVSALLRTYTELEPVEGIAPGVLWADAFVVVRADGVATAVIGERVVRYTHPPGCLTAGRTLVATAGSLQVWSRA
ncbi:hypothetical protein J2S43_002591 [Catenuloplanes nepalensis]|uniref:DUF2206 domain-containing protein n=1 Tax=Catenuloplanes nepalensis TaxID=587533 RepID=A0ABT9MRM0_9ACTN|nr:hypothetical protein [Catenuloplanes nepalensis]MDP9794079.1 hypothetical protein [Catenuloplanes nepalensis]